MWFSALVLLPIVCIGWWQIKIMLGLSWWSYGLMVGLSAICVAADTLINKMKPDDWNNENLVQTSMKLAHMKHIRKVQVSIQAFLLLLVIIAVAYDAYQANVLPHDRLLILGISMIVGAVIGGAVGLYILARMQRTNDDIINEIEAFKGKKAER